MDLREHVDLAAGVDDLYEVVSDLGRYPDWLGIVPRAEPLGGTPPAWSVDLRGRVGPFARSKRLRMVRTEARAPSLARFERREEDGREHSAWVLTAAVEPTSGGSRLVMHLHYGGSLWVPMIERLLVSEIERSKPRLAALVGDTDQTR